MGVGEEPVRCVEALWKLWAFDRRYGSMAVVKIGLGLRSGCKSERRSWKCVSYDDSSRRRKETRFALPLRLSDRETFELQ